MSAKKTPEQIVAERRAWPLRWMNDWSDVAEPEICLDGAFTLDQLRAIVAVREKQLGLPDPRQQAAADTLLTSTGPTHQVCIKAHETNVGNTIPVGHVVTGGLMQQSACWLPCDEYGWITHVPTADSVCPVPPGLEIDVMTQQTPTYRHVARVPRGRLWQVKWDEDSTVVAWRIQRNF